MTGYTPSEADPGTWVNSDHHPSVLLCGSELQSIRALKVVLSTASLAVRAMQTAEEALTRAALYVTRHRDHRDGAC
jgi:hypothetical protein